MAYITGLKLLPSLQASGIEDGDLEIGFPIPIPLENNRLSPKGKKKNSWLRGMFYIVKCHPTISKELNTQFLIKKQNY